MVFSSVITYSSYQNITVKSNKRVPLFYDALEKNDSAVKVLGDETMRTMAQELVNTVFSNVTIDCTVRENVLSQMCVLVKRILPKYGYPPDKQGKATQTVRQISIP